MTTLLGAVRDVSVTASVEVSVSWVGPALPVPPEGVEESVSVEPEVEPELSEDWELSESVSAEATPCPVPSAMHAPVPAAPTQSTHRLEVTAGL